LEPSTELVVPKKRGNPNFKKGMAKTPNSGRKVGSANRIATLVRAAVAGAGEKIGFPRWDKKKECWVYGQGGFQGYCEWMALYEPRAYAALVAKLLPTQVSGENGGPVTLRIIDERTPPQEAAQIYMEFLRAGPKVIDAVATEVVEK